MPLARRHFEILVVDDIRLIIRIKKNMKNSLI